MVSGPRRNGFGKGASCNCDADRRQCTERQINTISMSINSVPALVLLMSKICLCP